MSGSAPARTNSRTPHDLSERYEVVKKLGRGGMGEVFLAWKLGMDGEQLKLVVLKRVLPHLADEEKATDQFMAEMAVAATLEHRNIVRVADWGQFHGSNCFEMELIQGMSVDDLLKHHSPEPESKAAGTLPPVDVAWIAMQACQGLAYAHTQRTDGRSGIVHRDISPDNLMVDVDGEVKIADWGVAKPLTADGKATSTMHAIGKASYMPPEQWAGTALDGRADLYALGISLVVMLSGRQAFPTREDEGLVSFIQRVVSGARPTARELIPDAPPAMQEIVERMIAKSPDDRPPSAESLIEPFAQIARDLGGDLYRVQKAFAERVRKHHPKGKLTEPVLQPPQMTGANTPVKSEKRLIATHRDPMPPPSHEPPLETPPANTSNAGSTSTPRTARLAATPTPEQAAIDPHAVQPPSPAQPSAPSRGPLLFALAAAMLFLTALVAGTAAFFLSDFGEHADDGHATAADTLPPEPSSAEPVDTPSDPVPTAPRSTPPLPTTDPLDDPPQATPPAEPAPVAPTADDAPAPIPGRLTVVAIPAGPIMLDNRRIAGRNQTRVTVDVPAGRHTVVAGTGSERTRCTVAIRPGNHHNLEIDELERRCR